MSRIEMSPIRQLEGSSSYQLDISARPTSSCSKIRRKCRIMKVNPRGETARRSHLISTPRPTSSCTKIGRKYRILNVSYRGETARRSPLTSTSRTTSSCSKIRRKCRIHKVSYRSETARRSTDFKLHSSNNVDLFRNSTKMQNF